MSSLPEYWLRGPIETVPALLQPVAHALLQARDEVMGCLHDFPESSLYTCPDGMASVAFHLQHLSGVLDRLFTYAKGESLTDEQLKYLSMEGKKSDADCKELVQHFVKTIEHSIQKLSTFKESALTEARFVGRKQMPSTVIGLLFHAAEHTMRHTGQLLVTVKWVRSITIQ